MDNSTKVKTFMRENPRTILPHNTLSEAARHMKMLDCGILPVCESGKPLGVITDRDIVIRAVSYGKDTTQERVKDYMTKQFHTCSIEDTIEQAAEKMHQCQVSRLLVQGTDGKLCGIITFGSLLRKNDTHEENTSILQYAVKGKRLS